MEDKTTIKDLLRKPLCMMTGAEYVALHAYAHTINTEGPEAIHVTRVKGIHALAQYLCCSESQVYILLREGVLDDAILSSIGKSTVFDGEKARELAQAYMKKLRMEKKIHSK